MRIIFSCLLLLISTKLTSQSVDFPTAIHDSLEKYQPNFFREKVFVRTDQKRFVCGETIWFKVYVFNGSTNKLTDLSTIAYIEIIDSQGQVALQSAIELKNGVGSGNFVIPVNLSSGSYTLRAYTRWMRNFDPSFYFRTNLEFINPFQAPSPPSMVDGNVKCRFFPESGNLVGSLKTKIGFKISQLNDTGVDGKGYLLNEANDTLLVFSTIKFGIGSFELTPEPGKHYRALIVTGNKRIMVDLPPVVAKGEVLNISEDVQNELELRIASTTTSAHKMYLLAQNRDVVCFQSSVSLENGNALIHLSKSKLPDGVTHFTLFDQSFTPIAERLYFKRPEMSVPISVTSDSKEYTKRTKVNLVLNTKQLENQDTLNLSIAAVLCDSLTSFSEDGLLEYVWLCSELRGKIENPAYYFNSTSNEINRALDNLMLTHGWSRFRSKDILESKEPLKFIPELNGRQLTFRVRSSTGTQLDESIFLTTVGEKNYLYSAKPNAEGFVTFELDRHPGTYNLILQTQGADSTLTVSQVSSFDSVDVENTSIVHEVSPSLADEIMIRGVAVQVQEVFKIPVREHSLAADTVFFYGSGNSSYRLDDYTRFPLLEEVMREYVPEVWVRRNKDHFKFLIPTQNHTLMENPLVLFDGVPIRNIDKLMTFDALRVESVHVYNRKYVLRNEIFNGLVAFQSYDKDFVSNGLNDEVLSSFRETIIEPDREYYAPEYGSVNVSTRQPDKRTVLLWKPQVIGRGDSEIKLELFTSDIPGIYDVTVEAVTQQGKVATGKYQFKVK